MSRHDWESRVLNVSFDGKMYGPQNLPDTTSGIWAEYDRIAAYYDDVYLQTSKEERIGLWKTVESMLPGRKPRTLDLGAGTGGTFDARIAGAMDSVAVDPSQGMLNDLVMKYPRIARVVPRTAEEYLAAETGETFELAIASFGSASYLTPEVVEFLPQVLRPGGAVVLSFYRPGWRPRYFDHGLFTADDTDTLAAALELSRGSSEEHGNFLTVSFRKELN